MQVFPVPVSIPMANFNYAYVIVDTATGEVVLIDAAEVDEVYRVFRSIQSYYVKKGNREQKVGDADADASASKSEPNVHRTPTEELRIVAIMSTHDHHDHSGGNAEVPFEQTCMFRARSLLLIVIVPNHFCI